MALYIHLNGCSNVMVDNQAHVDTAFFTQNYYKITSRNLVHLIWNILCNILSLPSARDHFINLILYSFNKIQ
jgi:hypothetical protein